MGSSCGLLYASPLGTLLLSSVQDEIARLKVQYPRVKVTLKMGNPTDRNHVQNELLSTAERNGSRDGEGMTRLHREDHCVSTFEVG